MTLLALDVGFVKTGWVVFSSGKPIGCGIIKTERTKKKMIRSSDDNASRSALIAKELQNIISKYSVRGVVGELPSGGAKSARAMAFMAMSTGIAAAVLSVLDIPVEWVTPNEVKMALCGRKDASKDDMMNEVREQYPYIDWPKTKSKFEDVADAVGAYLAARDGNLVKLFG